MRAKTTTRPAHRLSRRRKGEETSESQLQRVRVRRGAGGVRVAARCPIYGRCRARRGGVWGAGEAGGRGRMPRLLADVAECCVRGDVRGIALHKQEGCVWYIHMRLFVQRRDERTAHPGPGA